MGQIFKYVTEHLPVVPEDSVFVEIGSERGEGSTVFFAKLAEANGTVLHTVDIDRVARYREYLVDSGINSDSVIWHTGEPGSVWCETKWPQIAKPISLLYLDNFDWIYDLADTNNYTHRQIENYHTLYGIKMTNENCQDEHFAQLLLLESWLHPEGVVVLDDTYLKNGVWTGKSGPAVVYLKQRGYQVVKSTTDCGVILKKC
jgi:hypothetical protein